jgi:hypothetical protein
MKVKVLEEELLKICLYDRSLMEAGMIFMHQNKSPCLNNSSNTG